MTKFVTSTSRTTTATAAEVARRFSHFSDEALRRPVVVTKNGRPRNVILSIEDFERLQSFDDRVAIGVEDIPDEFIEQIEKLARDGYSD